MKLLKGKVVLDCCCGSRMFWFDKKNPAVLFADIREAEAELCDGRSLEVIGVEPLFGHPSGKHGRTKWMAFMKGV